MCMSTMEKHESLYLKKNKNKNIKETLDKLKDKTCPCRRQHDTNAGFPQIDPCTQKAFHKYSDLFFVFFLMVSGNMILQQSNRDKE